MAHTGTIKLAAIVMANKTDVNFFILVIFKMCIRDSRDLAELLGIGKDAAYKRVQRGYKMIREEVLKSDGE